jgi:hypothetical protein
MRASRGIQAFIGQHQAFDRRLVQQERFNDFCNVLRPDAAIPHGFGVNYDRRPVFTLIQAPRFIGADCRFQPAASELLFEA